MIKIDHRRSPPGDEKLADEGYSRRDGQEPNCKIQPIEVRRRNYEASMTKLNEFGFDIVDTTCTIPTRGAQSQTRGTPYHLSKLQNRRQCHLSTRRRRDAQESWIRLQNSHTSRPGTAGQPVSQGGHLQHSTALAAPESRVDHGYGTFR